jgi:hypothetical protein
MTGKLTKLNRIRKALDKEKQYRQLARAKWAEEGELEIDDNAPVSLGPDNEGAYVQAWVWVDKPEEDQP